MRRLIGAIGLAALAVAAIACGTLSPAVTPTPTPTPTPPIRWATLTNTAFGYSIRHPADWLVNPYQPSVDPSTSNYVSLYNYQPPEVGTQEPLPPDQLKIEIVVLPNPKGLTLDAWVNDLYGQSPSEENIISSSSIDVNGVAGIKQVISVGRFEFFIVFFAKGQNVYVINGPQTNSSLLDIYEQMLNSFRFTQ